jgi:hypothetical protein
VPIIVDVLFSFLVNPFHSAPYGALVFGAWLTQHFMLG